MNIPEKLAGKAGFWINVLDVKAHGEKHWGLPEDTTGAVLIREIPDNTPVPGGVVIMNDPNFPAGLDEHLILPYDHVPEDWDAVINHLAGLGLTEVSIGIIVGVIYAAGDPIQLKSEGA